MRTYTEWANEIIKKVGTNGATKLIKELENAIKNTETNSDFDEDFYQDLSYDDFRG